MRRSHRLPSVEGMKKALVTGASRGLGRALATGLAAAGYALVIDARDSRALRLAADGIRADVPGADVTALPGDVTDPAHRAVLCAAGEIDLLVNNAGTLGAAPLPALADYPVAELRAAFEANVIAPIALTQLFLPALRERGGAILNVTSDAAVEPYAGWGGYGAAKAAIEQASNVLAAEETAIRVWWVDPATCAPTCTRPPSPARTSPTGRGRSRSCPPWSGWPPSGCRAGGTARPSWCRPDPLLPPITVRERPRKTHRQAREKASW
jgi:NAD(P)-dependent dehydrogenase (short-subunit alcohol dehydrogenase family)